MNAPWKPGAHGGRDLFQAFVCDEASASILRAVASELGWEGQRVNMGGLRNAVQSLSVSASPQILLVDLSETSDPLGDINGLAEVCEPGTIVIACGQVNDVRLYRDLLGSGIQDYLLKPLQPDHLRDALGAAQAAFMAPKLDAAASHTHVAAAIIGARGGAGASTIAASLAWLLSEKEKRSTALLDLDLHFGTAALTLDLEPGRGLVDAIENPSRIDGLFIERAMVRASDRLTILSSEAPISQPMLTDGGAFLQLQEEFRNAFQCSVVDLPRGMLIDYPQLLAGVNVVVIVAELTLACARDTIRLLSWLRSNAPHAKTVVFANKLQPAALEIARKDFEQSIERPIDVALPFDARLAAQAAKLGKPLAEIAKGSKLGVAYGEAVNRLLIAADESPSDGKSTAGGTSLLGKIGDFKAMLPKRKKAEAASAPVKN